GDDDRAAARLRRVAADDLQPHADPDPVLPARGLHRAAVAPIQGAAGGEPMSAILEVSGVTKRFGGLVAVNDVSFSLAAGEIAGILGPNGAGKTTLYNL